MEVGLAQAAGLNKIAGKVILCFGIVMKKGAPGGAPFYLLLWVGCVSVISKGPVGSVL